MLDVNFQSSASQVLAAYLQALNRCTDAPFIDAMNRIVDVLSSARSRGASIYIAGNGGSAATASHWVNDLGKATKVSGQNPIKVMSLSDNVSWLTALANDEGYERVFSGQLENFASPGDILIVLSASGNSRNLIEAVDLARSRGVTTIALLGFDGGVLKDKVDECLWLPTKKGEYGMVEGAHSVICHVMTSCVAQRAEIVSESEEKMRPQAG